MTAAEKLPDLPEELWAGTHDKWYLLSGAIGVVKSGKPAGPDAVLVGVHPRWRDRARELEQCFTLGEPGVWPTESGYRMVRDREGVQPRPRYVHVSDVDAWFMMGDMKIFRSTMSDDELATIRFGKRAFPKGEESK